MATKAIILISIVCYITSFYAIIAQENTPKLSRQEELDIEKQLNQLNKPSVKTIKTHGGVVYDCVDFFKQPAFDHPLLKNHSYHYKMKPHSRPKLSKNKKPFNMELKGLNCPIGTVPIRRTTKEDLIRSKLFTKSYASRHGSLTIDKPGLFHALVRTKNVPSDRYNGGGVTMSLYQPNVSESQYSSSQMTIKNGPDSIQVGWTVNPSLYGDSRLRLFTFMQAGATSCFNVQCPGFVIVSSQVPPDHILEPLSQRHGTIYAIDLLVYRDQANGNWWLEFGKTHIKVGFWPGSLFSALNTDLATFVDYGGEAYSPPGQPYAEMGNGYHAKGDQALDAFCATLTTIDKSHKQVDVFSVDVVAEDQNLYNVQDFGISGGNGYVMSFGGPLPP